MECVTMTSKIHKSKGCRTLEAKMANDIVPKNYQIGTKVGRVFFSEGGSMEDVKYVP